MHLPSLQYRSKIIVLHSAWHMVLAHIKTRIYNKKQPRFHKMKEAIVRLVMVMYGEWLGC